MKKILYLGTALPQGRDLRNMVHYPVIRLIPKSVTDLRVQFCLSRLSFFSCFLFTSKNAVSIFFDLCKQLAIDPNPHLKSKCFSIGAFTAKALKERGVESLGQAQISTQEGMWQEFACQIDLEKAHVLYPRSSLARSFLQSQLQLANVSSEVLDLYDVAFQKPFDLPSLAEIEEIIFTSPSTVEGFFRIFSGRIPAHIRVTFQGPITKKAFEESVLI